MNKQLDFLSIGDITTDAFIKLSEAWIERDNPNNTPELCMKFGEKLPYESVTVVKAVGNSANAAVAVSRLGLKSGLMTDVGDDQNGAECIETLRGEGVSVDYITKHERIPTNYHYVLSFGAERTILVKHEKYDYRLPDINPAPKWIYLSSLGNNSESYHNEIADYLDKNPEVKLAFQPGTFQIQLGKEKLKRIYKKSSLFFCNKEEAKRILETEEDDVLKLLREIGELGPENVCITDGPKGAYAFSSTSGESFFEPIYPDPMPPKNRTGAGDAFSSTFTAAIILGKPISEALRWGPVNSAYVVQQIGAQRGLLSREKLEEFLSKAPENYRPQKIGKIAAVV